MKKCRIFAKKIPIRHVLFLGCRFATCITSPEKTRQKEIEYPTHRSIFNHMVKLPHSQLDAVFHALADPTRRAILTRLSQGERSIGELAAPLNMSFAGASKHIKALEQAGLVQRTVQGRNHICRLEPEPMVQAMQWLQSYEHFWTERLDALEQALRQSEPSTPKE